MRIYELFDPKTAKSLSWDEEFANQGEVHASAIDSDGRSIDISFTPAGEGNNATEIVFTRGGSYDVTGRGNAAKILNTVVSAIDTYLCKYSPTYVVFSSKEGSRSSLYASMIKRIARGYELLSLDEIPPELHDWIQTNASSTSFVLKRESAR